MILVPCLFTVKTILMIAFILKFETMAGKFQSNLCHRRSEPFSRCHFFRHIFYQISSHGQYCVKGISEWSILATTLVSSTVFTFINLVGEIIFKMVNNQNQVLIYDQSFVLVFCFGEECIIPARVGIVSLY